jgi:hypothetical protein
MITTSNRDFNKLTEYLTDKGVVPLSVTRIRLLQDSELDKANRKNPRFLCAVHPHEWIIRCAMALDRVSSAVRVGVLLHEIGHMVLPAFVGAKSEVEVDEFVVTRVPEAGYYYGDHAYECPVRGSVLAKNVEHVSDAFLDRIGVRD